MKAKEGDLLLYLFHHQNQFLTSQQLAKEVAVSERTIRTYMRDLEDIVSQHGGEIIAKQGSGYKFITKRSMQFEMFINQKKLHDGVAKNIIDTAKKRQNYILNKLLLEEEHVFLENLCEDLFVSKSTMNKELNIMKHILYLYDLKLVHKSNQRIWIEGKEENKRSFIIEYFFKGTQFNSIQEYMHQTNYFSEMPSAQLILIIVEECRNGKLKLSDVMVQNILIHLMLTIKRIDKKLELKQFTLSEATLQSDEMMVAEKIIKRMEEELHIHFPKEEVAYLTLHLGSKNNQSYEVQGLSEGKLENELEMALANIDQETLLSLSEDTILKKNLMEHLRPMLIRITQSVHLKNPLLNDIIVKHKEVFDITKYYLNHMPSLHNFSISDDEWAYLTLHFMAAFERIKQRSKLQVLVICATGYGSAQLLKSRLEKEFGEYFNVVSEIGYFEMSEDILLGIDLIISSVNMSAVITGIPFIHVSVFLGEEDMNSIKHFIESYTKNQNHRDHHSIRELLVHEKKEIFQSYFQKDRFFVFSEKTNRKEVMKTLIASLSENEKITFKKDMMDQIALREKMSSIVFSDTVAVPHPAIPVNEKGAVAVAIITKGIAWNQDFSDIKFVILLAPSCIGNQKIKFIGQTIVRFIDHENLQQQLLEHQTFDKFQEIFLSLM